MSQAISESVESYNFRSCRNCATVLLRTTSRRHELLNISHPDALIRLDSTEELYHYPLKLGGSVALFGMDDDIYSISSAESSSEAGNLQINAHEERNQNERHEVIDKEMALKKILINEAVERRDVEALADLAVSRGGFLSDDLRQRTCMEKDPLKKRLPCLFSFSDANQRMPQGRSYSAARKIMRSKRPSLGRPCHHIQMNIKLTSTYSARSCIIPKVRLCFCSLLLPRLKFVVPFPSLTLLCPGLSEDQYDDYKGQLSILIRRVLRKYPSLGYFQGFHDISQVILLVLGCDAAAPVMERIALLRLRDYMLPTLAPVTKHLELIPAILHDCDYQLYQHVARSEPFYALAPLITMYAHDLEEYRDVVRLFDFLLAQGPVMMVYLYTAIILPHRKDILELPASDPGIMQCILARLARDFDEENAIGRAMVLYNSHPPHTLRHPAWKKVPRSSVLKTNRHPFYPRAMEEALSHLEIQIWKTQQALFFKKAETTIRQHRKPVAYIALAILVGVASYWMIKNDARGDPLWKRWYLLGMQFCMRYLNEKRR